MAYAFSAIDELLKGTPSGGEVQPSNIFAAESAPTVGAQTQATANKEDTGTKTVSEGTMDAAPSNPSATGKSTPSMDTNITADRAAITENIGKTQKPSAIDSMKGQLEANTERLQKEADQYLGKEKEKQNYTYDQNTVNAATRANRDEGAYNYISSLLGNTKAKEAGDFAASDVGVKNIDYLDTDAGLKKLISQGKDPRYSAGMSAFDLRTLRKTPEFNRNIADIKQQQKSLYGDVDTLSDDLAKQIQSYGAEQLGTAQSAVRGYLSSAQDRLRQQNEDEALAYNRDLAGLDLAALGDPVRQEAAAAVRARLEAANPYASRFIDPNSVDAKDFIRRNQELSAQDFISGDEAATYNNIMKLLGGGGQTWSESLGTPDQNYNIDRTALENQLLSNAESRYNIYAGETGSEIQRMKDAAEARANQEDARLAGLLDTQGTSDWQNEQAKQALEGSDFYKAMEKYITPEMLNASGYINEAPALADLGWQDVLSNEEALKLNELSGSIGAGQNYQGGGYNPMDPNRFDQDRYLADMRQRLIERQALGSGSVSPSINVSGGDSAGGGQSFGDALSQGPGGLASGAGVLGEAAKDYIVDYANTMPGGEAITGTANKAFNSAEARQAMAAREAAARALNYNNSPYSTYSSGPGSWGGGSNSPVNLPVSPYKAAEEAALRARLLAANKAYDASQGVKGTVGDIVSGVKNVGGDIASGAKNVGGDIARAAKKITSPFKKLRRGRW